MHVRQVSGYDYGVSSDLHGVRVLLAHAGGAGQVDAEAKTHGYHGVSHESSHARYQVLHRYAWQTK